MEKESKLIVISNYPLFSGGFVGGGGGEVTGGSVGGRGITDSYIGSLSLMTATLPFGIIPFVSSGGVTSEVKNVEYILLVFTLQNFMILDDFCQSCYFTG